MITRRSTIDQHTGTHPTGLCMTQLCDVVTTYDLDADDPKERVWVDRVHEARVALESLDVDQRNRAKDWLIAHGDGDDPDDIVHAIVAARETQP